MGNSHDRRVLRRLRENVLKEYQESGLPQPQKRMTKSSNPKKPIPQRIFDFFEQPLFLLPIAGLSGLIGMFYFWPVLALFGLCILLALHRSGAIRGTSTRTRVFAYCALVLITTIGMYFAGWLINKGTDEYMQKLGDVVMEKIKPLFQSTHGAVTDLEGSLVGTEELAISGENISEVNVWDPKFVVQLWNLAEPRNTDKKTELSLPMFVETSQGDFIRPHWKSSPRAVLDAARASGRSKNGDRLVGYASVTCSNCKNVRHYWISYIEGTGGWYSKIPVGQSPQLGPWSDAVSQMAKTNDPEIGFSFIPMSERLPILNPIP